MKSIRKNILGLFTFALLLFAGDLSAQQVANYDGCAVYAANAFTPNGDGVNDLFPVVVSENCNPVSYHLRIYDRWGRLVYESLDPSEAFNGYYDGQTLKEGVYLWRLVARYETPSQERIVSIDERGSVVLIR
ncbi:T9SS type B sorting domain-containing protein [Phaeocystidibacter luteus]|uniref:Gliding motility-associated C-terminal domain-containing protein n=1 Tax=Phaeocystidibacter luteus TaxID=911197 RepID=A0A6N6RJ96_9FLAO|nr:gliding motility-associated C-terminal domain-containing protein [Phaeocystidibacter luteus]KAB2813631.1 gliding motility-associated C-terminal domain-containing protein [Phaeocystidibacter luteus]